jgi:uncharacterized protein (TIGR02594 family)
MAIYVIRPGDTLGGIAKRHGTTLKQILSLNRQITDPDSIDVGLALNLPGDDVVPRANPVGGDAPWYQVALEELANGVVEIPGEVNNPRILEYHATCTLHATNDETAWCSAFVNWCMIQAARKGTNNAAARSWLDWKSGTRITSPRLGAVAVFARGTKPWEGHVGLFAGEDDAHVQVLGGNQGNCVSVAPQRKSKLLAYLWPKS